MKAVYYKIIMVSVFITCIAYAQNANDISILNKDLAPGAFEQIMSSYGQKALLSVVTNQANIEQVGSFNQAAINQTFGSGLNPNVASILQNNNYNNASIMQNGNGNNSSITQNGNGNEAVISINGNNNNSSIIQNGNNNVSLQNITANSAYYIITQQGDNNTLLKYDSELSPKAYIISQQGNGMHLIISGGALIK